MSNLIAHLTALKTMVTKYDVLWVNDYTSLIRLVSELKESEHIWISMFPDIPTSFWDELSPDPARQIHEWFEHQNKRGFVLSFTLPTGSTHYLYQDSIDQCLAAAIQIIQQYQYVDDSKQVIGWTDESALVSALLTSIEDLQKDKAGEIELTRTYISLDPSEEE